MQVNYEVLTALDDYHQKSMLMQEFLYEGNPKNYTKEQLREAVDDDLVFHVPIYDMLDRRYAAFCSLPEALWKREKDPKGNGVRFKDHQVNHPVDQMMLLYLFRLCGSGINYKPGNHGFGNFWIVKSIERGRFAYREWFEDLPQSGFSDSGGYLLPMIPIGLRNFILLEAENIVYQVFKLVAIKKRRTITEVVDYFNEYLVSKGYKRQTFVLSAFAADLAEYFPHYVEPTSMIYAGTNAKKCIKAIFGKCKEAEAIEFLADRYKSVPYSVEDSRLCDPVRYFLDYQSRHHVEANGGNVYKNNSILKTLWTDEEYLSFQSQLRS